MKAPDRITINGKTYARTAAVAVDSLFRGPATDSGIYKKHGNGVLLSTLAGDVFAFVSGNDGGFIVNATRMDDGRVRFMFGTSTHVESLLGITGYRHGQETARAFLDAIA